MQVEEFLEQSFRQHPEKIALVCAEEHYSYRQIEEASNRLAHALVTSGVKRGDRVAVLLPNSLEAVLAIFATLKAGAVFVVLNSTTKSEKLTYILNHCRASAIVLGTRTLPSDSEFWSHLPDLRSVFLVAAQEKQLELIRSSQKNAVSFEEVQTESGSHLPLPKQCIDIDLASLIYTSGSTGRPKGVMMTHLNVVSAATSITTYLENTADDVVINVLPLAFDYGLYQLLMMFKVGGTLVLQDSFAYPHVVLKTILEEGVTGFPIVPTISALLLQMDLSKYNLSTLRYITNTAASLPVEHIRKLRSIFPNVKIFSMYGLTECKRVSYLPPEQIDIRPGSVGRGMPNEEVYVVDDMGNRVGPGVVGELVIRGSNVMKGYWEQPEETARCLRPGPIAGEKVLYSGDLFRTDEEGYLYFVGRRDDMIKTRGEKVSPHEVEEALHELDGVAEAAVIGVPDAVLGSAVKAILILMPGAELSTQDVIRHCAARLEDFMVPKIVEFCDSLPKTESGKVSKKALRETAAELLPVYHSGN